jgi:hypothetical protein
MADLVNPTVVTTPGMMSGYGGYGSSGGMLGGGDGIGALLIGALLFGGGLGGGFGNNRNGVGVGAVDGVVTPTHLQAALNQQSEAQNTNHILQHLATIQQLIPESTAAVQLSSAANTFSLANQASQGQLASQNTAAQGQLQAAANTALLQNDVANARHNVNDNIHAGVISQLTGQAAITAAVTTAQRDLAIDVRNAQDSASANFSSGQLQLAAAHTSILQATDALGSATALGQANSNALAQGLTAGLQLQAANNAAALAAAVRDDGERTRSLIIAQNDTYLNRIITEQANALIELRNDNNGHRRARETEISVSQTVNQAQAQTQQQQQQQQQFAILGQIVSALNGLTQVAHATNQNVIAGNTGAVQTGQQNANPVNVA